MHVLITQLFDQPPRRWTTEDSVLLALHDLRNPRDPRSTSPKLLSPVAHHPFPTHPSAAHEGSLSRTPNEATASRPSTSSVNAPTLPTNRNPPTTTTPKAAAGGDYADGNVARKKSLVRPDREKIDPGHRQYHYHNRVANLQEGGNIDYMASGAYTPLVFPPR